MNNLKSIISANLVSLRKSKNLTQADLAKNFNYSPQAVSRWERGDTMPEIDVLQSFCEFYGITLDDIVRENFNVKKADAHTEFLAAKISMCALLVSVVWLVATCFFVYSSTINHHVWWQVFVYAVPVMFLVLNLANRRWGMPFKTVFATVTLSCFLWSMLVSIYIYFLAYNMWLIFLIGIPAQITIILWYIMKSHNKS